MTEELTLAIRALTCRFCAGEGLTAHRLVQQSGGALLPAVFGQRLCPLCHGSGLQPSTSKDTPS